MVLGLYFFKEIKYNKISDETNRYLHKGVIMIITFLNESSKPVLVEIDGNLAGSVASGIKRGFEAELGQKCVISLRHDKVSYKHQGNAHMNIETTYELSDLNETTVLSVTREKMCFESGAYYDGFILKRDGAEVVGQNYCVQGKEALREAFKHHGIKECLSDALWELFLEMLMKPLLTIIVIVLIVIFLGWKWLLGILLGIYVLCVIGEMFGNALAKAFFKLIKKDYLNESKEEELFRWMQPETIAAFYANPNREPYVGKIER